MRPRKRAGSDLQDAWHYFDSINSRETFGREARTLKGRIELYENGREALIEALNKGYNEDEDPEDIGYDAHDLIRTDEIEDEAQLKQAAKIGRRVTEQLAERWGIDASTGEPPEEW